MSTDRVGETRPWSERDPVVVDRPDLRRAIRLIESAGLAMSVADRATIARLKGAA